MAVVKIKFAHPMLLGVGYNRLMGGEGSNTATYVRKMLADGRWYKEESELFTVNGDSKDAAEEVFDLTNNYGRREEREEKYGNGRSLSVGDIVVVGEEQWVCCSCGWEEL